jgi:hypothetical protein
VYGTQGDWHLVDLRPQATVDSGAGRAVRATVVDPAWVRRVVLSAARLAHVSTVGGCQVVGDPEQMQAVAAALGAHVGEYLVVLPPPPSATATAAVVAAMFYLHAAGYPHVAVLDGADGYAGAAVARWGGPAGLGLIEGLWVTSVPPARGSSGILRPVARPCAIPVPALPRRPGPRGCCCCRRRRCQCGRSGAVGGARWCGGGYCGDRRCCCRWARDLGPRRAVDCHCAGPSAAGRQPQPQPQPQPQCHHQCRRRVILVVVVLHHCRDSDGGYDGDSDGSSSSGRSSSGSGAVDGAAAGHV